MKLNSLKVHNISEHWELIYELKKMVEELPEREMAWSSDERRTTGWRKAIREFFKYCF